MKNKLADSCFSHMFDGCKNLKIIEKYNPNNNDKIIIDFRKGHGAETYNKKAVKSMFKNCQCESVVNNSKFIKDGTPQKFFVYVQKK